MSKIVNLKKKFLNERGFKNFEDWNSKENTLYIGRSMKFYVKGTKKSKWHNPFSVKKFGRKKCLELYEKYILDFKDLNVCLNELEGKELGCWCHPESCHGDILIKLLKKKNSK